MSEYPPEVQAVLDAALEYTNTGEGFQQLDRVCRALRKAIAPPEPFERFMCAYEGVDWYATAAKTPDVFVQGSEVWRCTVTPVERVR